MLICATIGIASWPSVVSPREASLLREGGTMVNNEKMKGKAEQLKGTVEQAVGRATGSKETQARGRVHKAKGKAREKVADVKGEVKKLADKAKEKIAEIKGTGKAD